MRLSFPSLLLCAGLWLPAVTGFSQSPAAVDPGLPAGQAKPEPVWPNLTFKAFQNKSGKRIFQTRAQDGNSGTELDIRAISIVVDCWFWGAPPAAYEVQCFFFAKDEGNGEVYVYDCVLERLRVRTFKQEYCARPLEGTQREWQNVIVTGNNVRGGRWGDQASVVQNSRETPGSKTCGWVARVVAQGKPLKYATSSEELLRMVERNPQFFERMVEKTRRAMMDGRVLR